MQKFILIAKGIIINQNTHKETHTPKEAHTADTKVHWTQSISGKAMDLQHLSQKNLSSAFKVSVELKFFKQLVMEVFCSISRLKSKNVSSLAVTVSHRKHLVSFVSIPWTRRTKSHEIFLGSGVIRLFKRKQQHIEAAFFRQPKSQSQETSLTWNEDML